MIIDCTTLSKAEQEVLRRIGPSLHWRGVRRIERMRYFLAHSAADEVAVLRLKDQQGLEAWRRRRWRLFSAPPTITDVTVQALSFMEETLSRPIDEQRCLDVWVDFDDDFRLIGCCPGELPTPSGHRTVPLWAESDGAGYDLPLREFRARANPFRALRESVKHRSCYQAPDRIFEESEAGGLRPHRAFVWNGASGMPILPRRGQPIDGVLGWDGRHAYGAVPGRAVFIEVFHGAGPFPRDTRLEVDYSGAVLPAWAAQREAVPNSVTVLRALEDCASAGGCPIWAAFTEPSSSLDASRS